MIEETLMIDPLNPFLRVCLYCGKKFMADSLLRKFCAEKNGVVDYCKDHYHKPRLYEQILFRNEVVNHLNQMEIPGPNTNHKQASEMLHFMLQFLFDDLVPEYAIGGELLKRIDLCVQMKKIKVGIEIKLTSELEGNYSQHVNGLLGQLSYYQLIFKNNLIVAYIGNLSYKTRVYFEKVSEVLGDRGIIVVNIREFFDEI